MAGRPKKEGVKRRVQVHIAPDWVGVFDSYTPDELSSLLNQALASLTPRAVDNRRIVTVVRPSNPLSKTIARVQRWEKGLRVLFPEKNAKFREVICLKCGFSWENPYWVREVEADELEHELAHVAYNILSGRFCIQADELGIVERVIAGDFQVGGLRKVALVTSGVFVGWFCISWPRGGDNYYDEAIAITAAKYVSGGGICVPPEYYEELLDFAEQYDFSLTPAAHGLVETMQQSASVGFVPSKKQRQRAMPEISGFIPPGLVDED